MKYSKLGLIIIFSGLCFSIIGCDKKEAENNENESVIEKQIEQPISDTVDSDVYIEPDGLVEASESVVSINHPIKNDVPLSEYKDFNAYGDDKFMWFTPFFIAQTPREFSDEEKLELLSPEYYNERDGFKKQDLAKSELPKVKAEIDKYRGDQRISLPIDFSPEFRSRQRVKNHTDVIVTKPYLHSYDFQTQQFPIADCSFSIIDLSNYPLNPHNPQRIELKTTDISPKEDCAVEITDEALARKIEEAITAHNIGAKGDAYYKLSADINNLVATPVYAKVTFVNKTTGEELATKELHWD